MSRFLSQVASHSIPRGHSRRPVDGRSRGSIGQLVLLATAVAAAVAPQRAGAITISYTYDEREQPAFDPDGVELRRVTDAAIALWSSYILDNRSYHFDLSWENLGGNTLGQHEDYLGFATNNIIIDTRDGDGSLRNWFFDPTPFANEEFSAMQQTLVRDMDPVDADEGFSGSPPALLEVGYNGFAVSGSAAAGKIDLLSVVLHELGHHLGMNYTFNDSDYDFNSATVGGAGVGVIEASGYELNLAPVLMTDWPSPGVTERRLPSATDILATWDESVRAVPNGLGGWTVESFQNYNLPRVDFLGAESNRWDAALNWIGGAVPDFDNEVFLRHGGNVFQTAGNASAQALTITESSALSVQGTKLQVFGPSRIGDLSGRRGDLQVGNFSGGFSTFQTDTLAINDGVVNTFTSTGVVDVDRDFSIAPEGTLMGAGTVRVGGVLMNNGQISGGTFLLFGFGGTLTMGTTGTGRFDLDGNGLEQGQIAATTGNLAVFGPLADDFNGHAAIGEGRTMSFSRPWKMMGSLAMHGGDDAHRAVLSGDQVTIGGNVDVDGQAIVTAPVILNSPAVVHIPDASDALILAGPATLRGGTFTGDGALVVEGPTSVAMPNPFVIDDPPIFEIGGATRRTAANLTAVDAASFADVSSATTSAGLGIRTFTTFGLGVPLTVRNGGVVTASVSALYLPRTTTMSGGQIAGTNVVNQVGNLVVDGDSVINPTTFLWGVDNPAHATTIRSGARLDLLPRQIVRGADENAYAGQIRLEPGATLNVDLGAVDAWTLAGSLELTPGAQVLGDDIVNAGQVSGNGTLAVDRFENRGRVSPGRILGGLRMPTADYVQTPAGVLEMTLGDALFSNGSSLLTADTAQLAGTLAMSWSASFNPTLGDEYDLITGSLITGAFDQVLINKPLGSNVDGELVYRSNRVSFRITSSMFSADFNGDAMVDGLDLALWKTGYSGRRGDRAALADATHDGIVDGADFLAWQQQAGLPGRVRPLPGRQLGLAAVPEPNTMLLGLAAAAAIAGQSLGRKRASRLSRECRWAARGRRARTR